MLTMFLCIFLTFRDLRRLSLRVVTDNMSTIIKQSDFLHLTQAELDEILNDTEFNDSTTQTIERGMKKWNIHQQRIEMVQI